MDSENEVLAILKDIDTLESAISRFENTVFGEGAFSASKIKEVLDLIKFSSQLQQQKSSLPGFGSSPNPVRITLPEKQRYYMKSFDEFSDFITPIRDKLEAVLHEVLLGDKRVQELLKRSEVCIKELDTLRGIVNSFS